MSLECVRLTAAQLPALGVPEESEEEGLLLYLQEGLYYSGTSGEGLLSALQQLFLAY